MKKKHKIVLAPTEFINSNTIRLMPDGRMGVENIHGLHGFIYPKSFNYLYVLSNEEKPEHGDWIFHKLDNKPIQYFPHLLDGDVFGYGYNKIIATNDLNLIKLSKIDKYFISLSDDFIKEYCYRGGVDEIEVEYEAYGFDTLMGALFQPKVENEAIKVSFIKEKMFSASEVKKILLTLSPNVRELSEFPENGSEVDKTEWGMQKAYAHDTEVIDKYIKENL